MNNRTQDKSTSGGGGGGGGGEHCWISKCLVNESYLNDTSKYACDVCACKQEARMHTQYVHMPPVLILHLLSYGYTSSHDGELNAQKLSNRSRLIDSFGFKCIPPPLPSQTQLTSSLASVGTGVGTTMVTRRSQSQLKQLQEQQIQRQKQAENESNQQFRLFAVVMHSGQTLNSGHYTAFINYRIVHNLDDSSSIKPPTDVHSSMTTESDSSTASLGNTLTIDSTCTASTTAGVTSGPDWLHFDDTKVEFMSNSEFHRKIIDSSFNSPYILFYLRA